MSTRWIVRALAGVAFLAPEARGQADFRAGVVPVPGTVAGVSLDGVLIGPDAAGANAVLVSLDRVRSVGGEWSDEFEALGAVPEKAWRARTRLERGDALGAEPLFEELFAIYAVRSGPTARLVSEGLLRCRLRRAAVVGAVEAWLGVMRAGEGAPWVRPGGLTPVIDSETGLVAALPPIWVESPALVALAAREPLAEGAAVGDAMAEWYARAAAHECGIERSLGEAPTRAGSAGVVAEIVLARTGSPEERESARLALRARLRAEAIPAWMEAWCRAGIGRSLLAEPETEQRLLGIVELLHIPSRLADAHPYLSGLALAESARALHELGDGAGARRLLAELTEGYPTHPALDWTALDDIRKEHAR